MVLIFIPVQSFGSTSISVIIVHSVCLNFAMSLSTKVSLQEMSRQFCHTGFHGLI